MENVVLVIHLILAIALIAVVLMQRSEGGGLGMGGGGGGGAMTAGRSQATALGKVTWILAVAFIVTSIILTIIAAQNAAGTSIIDELGQTPPPPSGSSDPILPPLGDLTVPPSLGNDAPLVPSVD